MHAKHIWCIQVPIKVSSCYETRLIHEIQVQIGTPGVVPHVHLLEHHPSQPKDL